MFTYHWVWYVCGIAAGRVRRPHQMDTNSVSHLWRTPSPRLPCETLNICGIRGSSSSLHLTIHHSFNSTVSVSYLVDAHQYGRPLPIATFLQRRTLLYNCNIVALFNLSDASHLRFDVGTTNQPLLESRYCLWYPTISSRLRSSLSLRRNVAAVDVWWSINTNSITGRRGAKTLL